MSTKNSTNNLKIWGLLAGITVLAAFSRVLPHPYNISPVAAIALFSGVYIANRKWSFLLPLAAILLSDIILEIGHAGNGFYPGQVYVYFSYLLIVLLGYFFRNRKNFIQVAAASMIGSLIFFLISNFGSWLSLNIYAKDFSGLLSAYEMAIPFFRGTFLGDLAFNGIFFGIALLIKRSYSTTVVKA